MPVSREVYSVKVQMVLACIPIIDLWAAYRIEKLRVWILLYAGMILVGFMVNPTGEDITGAVIGFLIGLGISLQGVLGWIFVLITILCVWSCINRLRSALKE